MNSYTDNQQLLTWFANTGLGRDFLNISQGASRIVQLLPNSYTEYADQDRKGNHILRTTFYPLDNHFDRFLGSGLESINLIRNKHLNSFKETQEALLNYTGLERISYLPQVHLAITTFNTLTTGGEELGNTDAVFSTCRDAASGSEVNVTNNLRCGHNGSVFVIRRMVQRWDTSSLTALATITNVDVSIYIVAAGINQSTTSCDIVSSNATDGAIIASDYAQLGTTSYSNVALSTLVDTVRSIFTLDASGRAQINKTGNTRLGARIALDRANTSPGANDNYFNWGGMAEANPPQLIITYTVPAIGGFLGIFM